MTDVDLMLMSDWRTWPCATLPVERKREKMTERGVLSHPGEPVVSSLAGPVMERRYASWEDVLEAGWRPL